MLRSAAARKAPRTISNARIFDIDPLQPASVSSLIPLRSILDTVQSSVPGTSVFHGMVGMSLGTERFLLVALVFSTGCIVAQEHIATHAINPLAGSSVAVAAGQRLYGQACQACHGGEGRGDRGPALTTSSFPHGSEDVDLFRNIRTGIAGSEMPAFQKLTDDQVWQLISYIRSLNGSTAKSNEVVSGDPAEGEKLFYGKAACGSCHAVNAKGGLLGPDLSAAGKTAAHLLRAKILNPNTDMNPNARGRRGPRVVVVKTDDDRETR